MSHSPPLQWVCRPARERPIRAGAVAFIVLALALAAAQVEPISGFVCGALLFTSVSEGLLPTTFRLHDEGVSVSRFLHHRQIPWDALAGWRLVQDGVLLVGRGRLRLRAQRQTVLLRAPPHGGSVQELLRARLGPPMDTSAPRVAA